MSAVPERPTRRRPSRASSADAGGEPQSRLSRRPGDPRRVGQEQRSQHAGWMVNGAHDWNGGGMHFSQDYGFGLVDATSAVRLAESWQKQSTFADMSTETVAHTDVSPSPTAARHPEPDHLRHLADPRQGGRRPQHRRVECRRSRVWLTSPTARRAARLASHRRHRRRHRLRDVGQQFHGRGRARDLDPERRRPPSPTGAAASSTAGRWRDGRRRLDGARLRLHGRVRDHVGRHARRPQRMLRRGDDQHGGGDTGSLSTSMPAPSIRSPAEPADRLEHDDQERMGRRRQRHDHRQRRRRRHPGRSRNDTIVAGHGADLISGGRAATSSSSTS